MASVDAPLVGDLGPARLDLVGVRAGDKNEMNVTLKLGGVLVDVTDMTLEAQVRASITDTGTPPITAVISKIDAENGLINIRFPGAQVRAVLNNNAVWNGVWDLQQISDEDEDPVTLLAGTFQAEQDVTR